MLPFDFQSAVEQSERRLADAKRRCVEMMCAEMMCAENADALADPSAYSLCTYHDGGFRPGETVTALVRNDTPLTIGEARRGPHVVFRPWGETIHIEYVRNGDPNPPALPPMSKGEYMMRRLS